MTFLQHQALIREVINGVAFILLLTLVLMISVFLWDTWAKEGPLPYDKWAKFPGVKTACALWWIFAAESFRTCNVWLTYNLGKHDGVGFPSMGVGIFAQGGSISSLGYLIAGLVLNLSLLRAIYIWTPPDWREQVWIYASLGAMVFVTIPNVFM
jgi:hypothetical protein